MCSIKKNDVRRLTAGGRGGANLGCWGGAGGGPGRGNGRQVRGVEGRAGGGRVGGVGVWAGWTVRVWWWG